MKNKIEKQGILFGLTVNAIEKAHARCDYKHFKIRLELSGYNPKKNEEVRADFEIYNIKNNTINYGHFYVPANVPFGNTFVVERLKKEMSNSSDFRILEADEILN